MADTGATSYQQLLEEALELGRLDGRFAAAFEPPGTSGGSSDRCLGRGPADFARLLWEGRPGTPPAGLEANAPLWYATGYREGLAAGTAPVRRSVRTLTRRRVFT
jgi:hypothetical protein